MNRTNRSSIIKGGIIGGQLQSDWWKMNARFNREDLAKRIQEIAVRKDDIKLYNKDIKSFITKYVPLYEDNALIYFDPPYLNKGKQLYMNFFRFIDHKRIESIIRENVNYDWIIAYDVAPEIESIYVTYSMSLYDLKYSI